MLASAAALYQLPNRTVDLSGSFQPEPSLRSEMESLIVAHYEADSRFLVQPSVGLKQRPKLGPYEKTAVVGACESHC